MNRGRALRLGLMMAVALAAGACAVLLGPHLGPAGAAGTARAVRSARATGTAGSAERPRQASPAPTAATQLAPSRHVFIIVLGQASEANTFPAAGQAPAPYLADTMTAEGALLPNFYAIGHDETDDYVAMVSGQAPNADTQNDCSFYAPFTTSVISPPYHQQAGNGCIYPAAIQSIASQLQAAGYTWRDYNQSMGNSPTRESNECGHPPVGEGDDTQAATVGDAYAAKHNPFIYFGSVIYNTPLCDANVVNLSALGLDLQSPATTPNYVFITPDLCSDGSDAECPTTSRPGGYDGIDAFLAQYVPMITRSAAFKQGNGLLLVTFDQALGSDTRSCCGEVAGPGAASPGIAGAGGGQVGAVALSPCIVPGTVDDTDYDDYSLLGSIENIFGLQHLGYAQLPGQSYFAADLFKRKCNTPPTLTVATPTLSAATLTATPVVNLRFTSQAPGATYALEVRRTSGTRATAWKSLLNAQTDADTTYSYTGASGQTYEFRLAVTNGAGVTSAWTTLTVVVPIAAGTGGARLRGHWLYLASSDAWRGHADEGYKHATYTYSYTGEGLALLGTRDEAGGEITVDLDGANHRVSLHAGGWHPDQLLVTLAAPERRHTVKITVDSGVAALDALAITDLR